MSRIDDTDGISARSKRPMLIGAAAMFALSYGVFWATTRVVKLPPAWRTFEFCQYAEIGQNLIETGRFETRLVEPMALAMLDRSRRPDVPDLGRWPVVNRYPLPCFVIAGLMKLFGPSDLTAAWSNGLAISILGALGYAAAFRWFGARWAGVFGLLFLANPAFFGEFILIGTPDVWFAAVFLAELLVWSRFDPKADPGPRVAWAIGLGALGGLAFLSRFNATMLLGIQALVLLRWRRWREALLMGATAALVASPMFAYNWHHFRRPVVSIYSAWNLLDDIGAYRVEPWLYYRVPELWVELAAHADGVGRKFLDNLFRIIPTRIWNLWRLDVLFPLALAAPAFTRKGTEEGRFAAWSVGLFAFQLLTFAGLRLELEPSISPHHGRYFFWFATPAVLIALGILRRVSTRWGWARWLAAILVFVQLGLFANEWRQIVPRHAGGTNLGHDPIRQMLSEAADGRTIASNQPQITAWCSGLRSISLPANLVELDRLNRESPTPIDYLFIDRNYNGIDLDPNWGMLSENPRDFQSPWEPELLREYEYVIPPNRTRPIRYVFLRRRAVPPGPWELQFRAQKR